MRHLQNLKEFKMTKFNRNIGSIVANGLVNNETVISNYVCAADSTLEELVKIADVECANRNLDTMEFIISDEDSYETMTVYVEADGTVEINDWSL